MNHDYTLPPQLSTLTARELSLPSRLAQVALMLAALTMTVLVGALLATEPALPPRTRVAFGAMMVIGICWVGYAVWGLTVRRALLVRHQVVATTMGALFAATLLAGGVALLAAGGSSAAGYAAAALGAALLAIALVLRHRARARLRHLLNRRAQLEAQPS